MDISTIGTQYLNTAYVPFSSASASSVTDFNSAGSAGFGELLKRSQSSGSSAGASAQALPSSPSPAKPAIDKTDKLYGLCLELETFLIKNLIKSMRSTVQKSDLVSTGFAGEIYEDMLYDEYAKTYAKNANFGFAEMAYRELAGQR